MVDTGATLVAMNTSTARRIGIRISPADFKYTVRHRQWRDARRRRHHRRSFRSARIVVENVEAVVLDDSALDGTLIGMSFLKRLAKYQVENGSLLLVAVEISRPRRDAPARLPCRVAGLVGPIV